MSKAFLMSLSEEQLKLIGNKWLAVIANNKTFGEQQKIAQRILLDSKRK